MRFAIKKELEPLLHRIWKVSERICVLQLKTKPGIITIINTYSPHSLITKKDKTKAEKFYCSLQKTVEETKYSIMIFIEGDFNAKVGKKIYYDEKCCRQYFRGIHNENGSKLTNFCQFHDLIITNTLFQHPARHITIWTSYRKNNNYDITKIYNQIDYVICKYNQRAIIYNTRTYGRTELNSDHKIVICKINFKKMYPNWKEMTKGNNSKKEINYEMLKEKETEYKNQIESKIINTENITWDSLKNIMKQSGIETVGMRKKIKNMNSTMKYNISLKCKKRLE